MPLFPPETVALSDLIGVLDNTNIEDNELYVSNFIACFSLATWYLVDLDSFTC